MTTSRDEPEGKKTCPKCRGDNFTYSESNYSYSCHDCYYEECAKCGKSMPECIDRWLKRGRYAEAGVPDEF